MSYNIDPTFTELGYNELIAFLIREFNTPTPGGHSNFVTAVLNGVIAGEETVFLQELYTNDDVYKGCFVIGGGFAVYLENLQPLYWSNDTSKFTLDTNRGLIDFIPGETFFYENADLGATTISKIIQVAEYISLGTALYSVTLKTIGLLNVEAASYISARITLGGYVTSYSINLKNLGQIFITFANSANRFLNLTVPINENRTETVILSTIGQQASVPLTDSSRQYIDGLINQGLVYEI